MAKFEKVDGGGGDGSPNYMFWCPGCECLHGIWAESNRNPLTNAAWDFNGDINKPTVSPSILRRTPHAGEADEICHSYVKDGQIQFLGDCTHKLAGQTVEIPEWEHQPGL